MAWRFVKVPGSDSWHRVNRCERCGADFSSCTPSAALYCPACAPQVKLERNRERVRRYRERHKPE